VVGIHIDDAMLTDGRACGQGRNVARLGYADFSSVTEVSMRRPRWNAD
jgi:hypothetical protein